MQEIIAALKAKIEGLDRFDPMRNILEKLLKACEGKVFTSSEPLTVLVIVAIGGVLQTVDAKDSGFIVAATGPSDDLGEAEKTAKMFRELGFVCELKRRTRRPAKPRKGEADRPIPTVVPEILHILYLPG